MGVAASIKLDSRLALSLTGITRRFGQVMALDKAWLAVREGTVHAVLGENGAGKSTLMRVAFGLVQPDAGIISVAGEEQRMGSPRVALNAGIGMVHQHFTLVPAMTVAENVALGNSGRSGDWAQRVREIGQQTGLELDPALRVRDLPVGAQQRCEIIKALVRNVNVLILDEPTAVLAPAEARDLLAWMREFADAGHAVVIITHKLRDALAVADDVTVLRRGRTVLSKQVGETDEAELAAAILGEEHDGGQLAGVSGGGENPESGIGGIGVRVDRRGAVGVRVGYQNPANEVSESGIGVRVDRRGEIGVRVGYQNIAETTPRAAVWRLQNVTVRDDLGVARVDGATLEVQKGEILGIAAVEGAGQRELLRVLAGRIFPTDGQAIVPDDVGFVPEDRHLDALVLDASLVENVALRGAGARRGRMPWHHLGEATRSIINEHGVRAAGEYAKARTLSGGNQQKLIVGRELAEAPAALVVESPTRGLDFRAARAVHDALRNARANGAAVVVYSSDLDEVMSLSDRVVVMESGRVHEVTGGRDAIGAAMLGML